MSVRKKDVIRLQSNVRKIVSLLTVVSGYKLISELENMAIVLDATNASWVSSELLTETLRDYIISGDKTYYDRFWQIVDIRTGYGDWDNLIQLSWFKNRVNSLPELYDIVQINPKERKYFDEAYEYSLELLWFQIQALNWNLGYYDESGNAKKEFESRTGRKKFIQFGTKGEPDPQKAIDLLYSEDYIKRNLQISSLAHTGIYYVLKRYNNTIRTYEYLLNGLILTDIIMLVKSTEKHRTRKIMLKIVTLLMEYITIQKYKDFTLVIDTANALQITSDMLSRNIKNYIITGNKLYYDRYWEIVNVRTGKQPWDKIFFYSWFDGKKYMLQDLYKVVGFTEEEQEPFLKGLDLSNELVWKEIQSFNWYDGFYDVDDIAKKDFSDDIDKKFIKFQKKGEPDKDKAIKNIYNSEYLDYKKQINDLTFKGVGLVLEKSERTTDYYKYAYYGILGLNVVELLL